MKRDLKQRPVQILSVKAASKAHGLPRFYFDTSWVPPYTE